MAHIIDGKKISIEIKDEVKKEVETLLEKGGFYAQLYNSQFVNA